LWLPHRALGFLVSWPLIGRLAKTNAGAEISKYSKYAFFIFLAHYYVVIILFKVFDRMFSMDQFYIYFIFCFPLTILICISTQKIMHRFFPKALSLATGNRIVARI
jgi:succinoglycan biosynthesis protein ExoH